ILYWMHLRRRTLSSRIGPAPATMRDPVGTSVAAMITPEEQRMLAWLAERIWAFGVDPAALIVDAGCFVGASTLALASGLRRAPLSVEARRGKIWSYDLFRVIDSMIPEYFPGSDLHNGDTFRPVFEQNVRDFRE